MLEIPCPWCGPRAHVEFSYGGDGTRQRPGAPLTATAEDWHAYIYLRDNPRGEHVELWQHTAGCRAWLRVRRDTLTHAVLGAEPARVPGGAAGPAPEPPPEPEPTT